MVGAVGSLGQELRLALKMSDDSGERHARQRNGMSKRVEVAQLQETGLPEGQESLCLNAAMGSCPGF